MQVKCAMCGMIVDPDGTIKDNHGYKFLHWFDADRLTYVARPKLKRGYLCYDCQRKIEKVIQNEQNRIQTDDA